MELWRDIDGFEGLYQVSNMGNIRGLPRTIHTSNGYVRNRKGLLFKSALDTKATYITVILCKDGKRMSRSISRLVAVAFIPNPDNLSEVNHKDENKHNNCSTNLEWCDRKYNANYGTGKIRNATAQKIPIVAHNLLTDEILFFDSSLDAERANYGLRRKISQCCRKLRRTYRNYEWWFQDNNCTKEKGTCRN